jgi:precorrin-8X/cobalt-precorrin-8 methylmutase
MFDQFVAVDWSANSSPKRGRDSIWIAFADGRRAFVQNHATRSEAEHCLGDIVEAGRDRRTLIGIDVSLGYPTGTAHALGFGADPWCSTTSLISEAIVDDARNANNRFDVAAALNRRMTGGPAPFWGCPPKDVAPTLRSTKPTSFGPVDEWRIVERRLRRDGARPFSSWQLLGAGAVGSQTLLGLPMVYRLLRQGRGRVHVWPFTTGLAAPTVEAGTVVIVELWPSMLASMQSGAEMTGAVRDELQVRAATSWLESVDADGSLAGLFAPDVTADERRIAELEEGWVLGVAG